MTEDERREGIEETKDNAKEESEETKAARQDRQKGSAEEGNQEGEGAIGGIEDDDLERFGEAKWG